MFDKLKKEVAKSFKELSKHKLFYVDVDKEAVWNAYLDGFTSELRQEHNCNCCRSFLRQNAGIIAIVDNKVVSLWDNIDAPEDYRQSIKNLSDYIHSMPVTDIFLSPFAKCGTDKNLDTVRKVTRQHFYLELPKEYVHTSKSVSIDTVLGNARANKDVLKRGLDELRLVDTNLVLELIAQNSLYRGAEFKGMLTEFQKLQKAYAKLKDADDSPANEVAKDAFCWVNSLNSGAVSRIRNSAIGTLLVDLSQEMGLEEAVTKYERVVAPNNYKRPTAIYTTKMVEQAKAKLAELGLLDSLERRFANETDLNINNILFTQKPSAITNIFDEVVKEATVNPRLFSKAENIGIDDFIQKILPTTRSVELLLENTHLNNFVSLITSQNPESKSPFKWGNPFSWSYTGGITDSIKDRVKAAGGKIDGVLRYSIQWNKNGKSICDLDAYAYEPDKTHIYFGSYRGTSKTSMTGNLDVDMIRPSGVGVENITWSNRAKMKPGKYVFGIHNFDGGRNDGFEAEIEFDGEVYNFVQNRHLSGKINVAEVTLSKDGIFTIKPLLDSKSSISSIEKWGVKTNQFHKVTKLMLSPNFWNDSIGNKHFFFFLENCISDEIPRGFFNEYLTQELDEHRKVFEVVGSKIKIEPTNNQLSGVGFSSTIKNSVILKVNGNFNQTLRVVF